MLQIFGAEGPESWGSAWRRREVYGKKLKIRRSPSYNCTKIDFFRGRVPLKVAKDVPCEGTPKITMETQKNRSSKVLITHLYLFSIYHAISYNILSTIKIQYFIKLFSLI